MICATEPPQCLTEALPGASSGSKPVGPCDDAMCVSPEVAVKRANSSGLAEMFDPQRHGAGALHCAQPCQRCRMPIDHGDKRAMRRKISQQLLNMGLRVRNPFRASAALPSSLR